MTKKRVGLLILLIACVSYMITLIRWYNYYLSSDLAGAIVNAVIAMREKNFIPYGFNYTSICGFQSHVIFIPLIYRLSGNIIVSFLIANVLTALILCVVVFYFMKLVRSYTSGVVAVVLLLIPLSNFLIDMHTISQFYDLQLIGIIIGLILFYISKEKTFKQTILICVIAFINSFLQNLNGLRFISYFTIPFVVAIGFLLWKGYREKISIKSASKQRILVVGSTLLGNIVGLLYFIKFIEKTHSLYSFSMMAENDAILGSKKVFDATIDSIYMVFGLFGGVLAGEPITSINGFLKLVALGFTVLLIIQLGINHKVFLSLNTEQQFFCVFTLFCYLFNNALCIVLEGTGAAYRYDYIPIVLFLFCVIICIDHMGLKQYICKNFVNFLFFISVCLMIFGGQVICLGANSQSDTKYVEENNKFINENDCNFAYATYWNANRSTVLSNMEIEYAALSPDMNLLEYGFYPWFGGMARDYYKKDYHVGNTAVVLTHEENEIGYKNLPLQEHISNEMHNDKFDVYIYDLNPFDFEEQLYQYSRVKGDMN